LCLSSGEEFQYEEVDLEGEDESMEEPLDYETLVKETNIEVAKQVPELEIIKEAESKRTQRPEVIDDFIRNFLVKYELRRTLEAF